MNLETIENYNLLNTNSISQGPPVGKTFMCNMVDIFWCFGFINCFGYSMSHLKRRFF